MTTSITAPLARDCTRGKWATSAGLAIALACLLTAAPLRAADVHRGGPQHAQRHAPRQAYRHDNYRGGGGYYNGYPGYLYGAPPPLVYGPPVVPGINLFLPL